MPVSEDDDDMTDTVRLAAALLGKADDADAWADSYRGQRLEAWMRGFAHVARLAATVLEKCPKVVDLGDDAAPPAPATDMREALARQIANAQPGHDSLGSFGPDGLVLHVSREQRDFLLADLSASRPTGMMREALEFAVTFKISDGNGGEVAEDSLHEIRKVARKALAALSAPRGEVVTPHQQMLLVQGLRAAISSPTCPVEFSPLLMECAKVISRTLAAASPPPAIQSSGDRIAARELADKLKTHAAVKDSSPGFHLTDGDLALFERALRELSSPAIGEDVREALEPFAAYADPTQKVPPEHVITAGSSIAKRQLTMGDCYRAVTSLALINSK